ncbi:hypothetical protein [Acidovorax radicis]|uniref:hypothetical protein n=1 Tax=Acidovorax radicis TaxID=758826 RepID=UPI0002376DFA|nr:hypothetical protein [Acidovorax radicis]
MSDALMAPTYAEVAQMHRHFKLLYGNPLALDYLLATPAPTGAQLQAWLATPANLVAFQQLITAPNGAAAVCASSGAMAAVAGSTTAMQYVLGSSAALNAMLFSNTAMTAVAASNAAMTAITQTLVARSALSGHRLALAVVAANPAAMSVVAEHADTMAAVAASVDGIRVLAASATAMGVIAASANAMAVILATANARMAVYDTTVAWDAIAAAPAARTALSNVAVLHSTSLAAYTYPPGVAAGIRAVLVQQKTSSAGYPSIAGASADTYTTVSLAYIDRYVRVTGLTHRIDYTGASSSVRYVVMQ